MRTRQLHQLLTLLRNDIVSNYHNQGMCYQVKEMKTAKLIDSIEADILLTYINVNRPRFAIDIILFKLHGYWWTTSNIKNRIKWLNSQIENVNKIQLLLAGKKSTWFMSKKIHDSQLVFLYVIDLLICADRSEFYICHILYNLLKKKLITSSLYNKCMNIFYENRPNSHHFSSWYEHQSFHKPYTKSNRSAPWWSMTGLCELDDIRYEKITYLLALINYCD